MFKTQTLSIDPVYILAIQIFPNDRKDPEGEIFIAGPHRIIVSREEAETLLSEWELWMTDQEAEELEEEHDNSRGV